MKPWVGSKKYKFINHERHEMHEKPVYISVLQNVNIALCRRDRIRHD